MPAFSLAAYSALLDRMLEAGADLLPVTSMGKSECVPKTVFLRHDIDFSLELCVPMAEVEASKGIKATYYILLNGPYSVDDKNGRRHLLRLVELGHEIGLHYDLKNYPDQSNEQKLKLESEIEHLEHLIEQKIPTITMHEPHRTAGDPFKEGPWIHPHNPILFNTVRYVSDSCRAWRDESLLEFFSREEDRLLFLTHPELWMNDNIKDRFAYLEQVVIPSIPQEAHAYFTDEVPLIWKRHLGSWLHDFRELLADRKSSISWLSKEQTTERLPEILSLFEETPELPWTKKEIMMDVPQKWLVSAALFEEHVLRAVSFNSVQDNFLYIHAIVVDKNHRRKGVGNVLLRQLQIRARTDFEGIRLRVHDTNVGARKWYEQQGFQEVAQEADEEQSVLEWKL